MDGVSQQDRVFEQRATELLTDALVWDNHGCMPLRPNDGKFLPQLERYHRAGIDLCSLNVGFDALSWENTVLMLSHFRHWIRERADDYLLVDRVDDVEQARRAGKLAVTFDIEGGTALNDQLSMVELYRDLGVRWMLIAYNQNNSLGGGCQDDDQGLTDFGRRVVDEMARVGMVTCCSHTGFRTTMELMEYSVNPVIFSHSNPLRLWDHKRNIRDEAMLACAKTGGVVGINGIGIFLGRNDARTEAIVRHIDYVVQLIGPEHVGLGLDYVFDTRELDELIRKNPKTFPADEGYAAGIHMVEPKQVLEIAEALLHLGYAESDIRLILGENHLRVAEKVWK